MKYFGLDCLIVVSDLKTCLWMIRHSVFGRFPEYFVTFVPFRTKTRPYYLPLTILTPFSMLKWVCSVGVMKEYPRNKKIMHIGPNTPPNSTMEPRWAAEIILVAIEPCPTHIWIRIYEVFRLRLSNCGIGLKSMPMNDQTVRFWPVSGIFCHIRALPHQN